MTTSENTDEEMTGIEIHVKKGVSEEEQDAITTELNNLIDDQEESITGSILKPNRRIATLKVSIWNLNNFPASMNKAVT